jgi:YHS domain-containing protein
MKKLYLVSTIAGAMLFATAAMAAEFDDMCAMGLALGKDVHTDCSISGEIGGKTYCFGSEDAMTQFMKDPEGNLSKAQAYYKKTH